MNSSISLQNSIVVRLWQNLNVVSSMTLTAGGMMIFSSDVHCPNASPPISSWLLPRVTVCIIQQWRNAHSLIIPMALGMTIPSKFAIKITYQVLATIGTWAMTAVGGYMTGKRGQVCVVPVFFQPITNLQIYRLTLSNIFVQMVSFVAQLQQNWPFSFADLQIHSLIASCKLWSPGRKVPHWF